MSRTTTATVILHHHVEQNATAAAPPTSRGVLRSQIEREGQHLFQSSTSDGDHQHPKQRRAYLAHRQRHAEHPPLPQPLLRIRTIPLPALADVPIYVNPLLSYHPFKVALEYDLRLPPITAYLPPTAKAHSSHRDWRQQAAMNPSTVGSMTIIVPGFERVVVVFPATPDDVVKVGDVLVAVYCAMQESDMEHYGEFGIICGVPPSCQDDVTTNAYTPAREELAEDHLWAGLYPSQNERDVWVLRTRRVDRR